MPWTPPVDATRLQSLLGPGTRWSVHTVPETGSTNRDVAGFAREGMPAGMVLVAEHQTAGRGRFARVWGAPPGSSVAVSVLLRPTRPAQDWHWLALVAGLAVVRAARETSPLGERPVVGEPGTVVLKWPNDVLVEGRGAGKLCGILAERHDSAHGPAAVLGIGLNVHLADDELPVPTATSLVGAGLCGDKDLVLAAMLRHLAELVDEWEARGHLADLYERECATVGRRVRVHLSAEEVLTGRATGVDRHGRLEVLLDGGGTRTFVAGDVVHLRPGD